MFFETIKCEDFEIFNLEYHQKELQKLSERILIYKSI